MRSWVAPEKACAFETPEPAAPAGSAGVAQAAETASESSSEDFLDAVLEVRDYPTAEADPKPEEASPIEPEIDAKTEPAAAPRGDEAVSGSTAGAESQPEAAAPSAIDADASADRPDGSIEPRETSPSSVGTSDEVDDAASGGDPVGRSSEDSASNEAGRASDADSSGGLATDLADSGGDPASAEAPARGSRGSSRILIDLPEIDVEPIEARGVCANDPRPRSPTIRDGCCGARGSRSTSA